MLEWRLAACRHLRCTLRRCHAATCPSRGFASRTLHLLAARFAPLPPLHCVSSLKPLLHLGRPHCSQLYRGMCSRASCSGTALLSLHTYGKQAPLIAQWSSQAAGHQGRRSATGLYLNRSDQIMPDHIRSDQIAPTSLRMAVCAGQGSGLPAASASLVKP